VTFARPFFLRQNDCELPAGSYSIETDEEALGEGSTPAYHRVEIRLFVPRIAGRSEAQMLVIHPRELDDALMRDRQSSAPALKADMAAPDPLSNEPTLQETEMRKPNKDNNLPLYGTCLGILALLFVTWVVHQQNPEAGPRHAQTTRQN
jgi:hypothetical protein